MGLMDRIGERVGMAPPALRVVREDETVTPEPSYASRTAAPETLAAVIGQKSVVFNLTVECGCAAMDQRLPDHLLLEGPAGLGKTTLARGVAAALDVRYVEIPATALTNIRDGATALSQIGEPEDGPCVVFVDEIHVMCQKVETLLLSALQEGWFQPSGAEKFVLAPFCLIGATTNPGILPRALRDRFGLKERLTYYPDGEISAILTRYAGVQGWVLGEGVADQVAAVGRGTPRVAIGLLRRIQVFAHFGGEDVITAAVAAEVLVRLGIDAHGLDSMDREILTALFGQSSPIGIEALASMLDVDMDAVKLKEPYLMRREFMLRSSGNRGRVATRKGYRALGVKPPVWLPRY